jgi:endo-1,4-beta-D-glucanase Y
VNVLMRATGCLVVAVLAADVGVVACDEAWSARSASVERGTPVQRPASAARRDPVVADAREFLRRYVEPDGRVVRHDQGGDTVSEGQAYAMLLAVVVEDRATFDRAWTWARVNLARDDGLLAWHWADGRVVDAQPATDADLDAAWALALAERRWPGGGYADSARVLVRGVDASEVGRMPDGRPVILPGPWARDRAAQGGEVLLNPSYSSAVGEQVLVEGGLLAADASRARRATMRSVVRALLDRGDLPSDWVSVGSNGELHRVAGPDGGSGGRYGWDAVRIPLRLAASCDREDRDEAARLADRLRGGAGSAVMADHPARLVAVASAVAAAGEEEEAADLLDRAARAQAAAPTYYGGALVALGRALLTTDRLGGCPPA